jgi:hypothetical protein
LDVYFFKGALVGLSSLLKAGKIDVVVEAAALPCAQSGCRLSKASILAILRTHVTRL